MIKKLQEIIFKELSKVCDSNNLKCNLIQNNIEITQTQNNKFGDYTSNILMILKRQKIDNIKDELIKSLNEEVFVKENISRIDYVEPGFLNFTIKRNYLLENLNDYLNINRKMFWIDNPKKYLIEHTSPNTNKALHIGHLRNNVYAMAVYRLLLLTNNKVTLDCVNNDRGIHICKAIWGYLKKDKITVSINDVLKEYKKNSKAWATPESENVKTDKFVENCYKIGIQNEENEGYKKEMQWLLREWEANNPIVRLIWKKLNSWVYIGFRKTYKMIGSLHHYNWYESLFYKKAKQWIKVGLDKKVFVKLPDGAVLSDLKNYNLTDNILQRSDGTAMYFTQDICLTQLKVGKFKADKYIWVVGPEQILHFEQLFAICDQLKIGNIEKFKHLTYGYVFWKDGSKMSSRIGNVMAIDDLVSGAKERVLELSEAQYESLKQFSDKQKDEIALKIAIGSIKYALLRLEHNQDLHFDFEDILDTKTNGSPYIQYTYARTYSILEKSKTQIKRIEENKVKETNEDEEGLLRELLHFNEIVKLASNNFSPHLLTTYLFDLCKAYNAFYEKHKVLSNDDNEYIRLAITKTISNIIKLSMEILGIEVMNKL